MSFRIAEKQAKKSTFKQHRVGAVLVKGSRVLSTGYNKYGYTKELKYPTIHAEEMAIVKLLKLGFQDKLVNSNLYVTRFTPAGNLGIAKPCSRCMELIRSVGVSHVYFIGSSGVERMRVK